MFILDEETENGSEGDDDKDTPLFYLSNEVIFTNQKMTRFVWMHFEFVLELFIHFLLIFL